MTNKNRFSKNIIDRMYFILFYSNKLMQLGDNVIAVDSATLSRTAVRKYDKKTVTDYRVEHQEEGWRCVVEQVQSGRAAPRAHIRSIYPADDKTAEIVHAWIRRQGEAP